jgi:hypothetical protein
MALLGKLYRDFYYVSSAASADVETPIVMSTIPAFLAAVTAVLRKVCGSELGSLFLPSIRSNYRNYSGALPVTNIMNLSTALVSNIETAVLIPQPMQVFPPLCVTGNA